MFSRVLVANRGAIACRILRTLRRMGIGSVAVYSEADRHAAHVRQADTAVCLGPAPAAESYLRADGVIAAALATGAQAIHPGYGFLSENADFAEACERAGLVFVGPTPEQMRAFGLKHTARALAEASGVPLLPGSGVLRDADDALAQARRIGLPVMLKSSAGGGGIGMRLARTETELAAAFDSVQGLARANFRDGAVYLERYVERARHLEVQIFGDGQGRVVALGERDCSLQRRHQKVVEETPAPHLDESQRARLLDTAVRLGLAVGYRSAGTVEFVHDADRDEFHFLEVNTRLQVEHGVTEEVTGIDLVEWMLLAAAGELDLTGFVPRPKGAAIQARIYAEDPGRQFQPCPGQLTSVRFPAHTRVETWVEDGTEVPAFYDPLVAKVIARGMHREAAREALLAALDDTALHGVETNLDYLRQVLRDPAFAGGRHTTRTLESLIYRSEAVEVLEPGMHTTVQDWPGRTGYWDVGVPPSGPMDALSMRIANRLVGNPEGAAALEITASGPTLRFRCEAVVALTGAGLEATLDGKPLEPWRARPVPAGATLRLGAIRGPGLRACLAVQGGLRVPETLGSSATFTLGRFGGHGGRALRTGDVLRIRAAHPGNLAEAARRAPLAQALRPPLGRHWELGVLYGPHGAPDFFTDEDVAVFFATDWEVHYNSSRTGVRLVGPRPAWARSDGGEAGLHPSNIHDNAYAVGAVDFTGDMPVILGPDGPSLGGFVCPATVVQAELWKLGQLRPGDTVRFRRLSRRQANALERAQHAAVAALDAPAFARLPPRHAPLGSPVLRSLPAEDRKPALTIRQSGDHNLLVEVGPPVLDLELRLHVQVLMEALRTQAREGRLPGVIDMTPGVRSLQLHFDPRQVDQDTLVEAVVAADAALPALDDMEVPSRIVYLPLSWDDPATRLAIERYTQSVRVDAPWCPSNIEFIRRINGLDSVEDVRRVVFGASYLVMGLGDVYLGAPVATPLDPRHRLVTTKYNPARTWTPENAVGIGGAYLCVYGMEGPGGYQFVGRTVQMWNPHRRTAEFEQPWLLRFFDQIRFVPVTESELLRLREDFPAGRHRLRIEPATFRLREHREFLARHHEDIEAFRRRQRAAFEAERRRWKATGQDAPAPDPVLAAPAPSGASRAEGARAVTSPVAGQVWKLPVRPGDTVRAGETVAVLESMKMEIPVAAPCDGRVGELCCREGGPTAAGQELMILEEST